jgi:hypothetical protein
VLNLKDEAHYGLFDVGGRDLKTAMRMANELVRFAEHRGIGCKPNGSAGTPAVGGVRHTVGMSAPQISLNRNGAAASPEEAAAVVAALERFMRATAPAPATAPAQALDGWRRAAMLEGVEREAQGDDSDPWINT